MAQAIGETDAISLLEENLKEEKEALREVESVTKTYATSRRRLLRSPSMGGSGSRSPLPPFLFYGVRGIVSKAR
jgi:hypothetical protein